MLRPILLATALLASGCSEFQFVSTAEPYHGDDSTGWTDPQSPVDPQTPSDPSVPEDGEPPAPSGVPIGGPDPGRRSLHDGAPVGNDPEADPPVDDPEVNDTGLDDAGIDDPEVDDTGLDDPDPGDAADPNGCTPGYWKQEQHLASWPADLTPDTLFVDVFGYDAFPGLSLLDVLGLGEGDLDALGRHSVAALLNSLSDGVDYPLTDADVLDAFANAFESGVYIDTKDEFEAYNEVNCPLS